MFFRNRTGFGAVCLFVFFLLTIAMPVSAQETALFRIEAATAAERAAVADSGADIQYVNMEEGWILAEVPAWRVAAIDSLGLPRTRYAERDAFPADYSAYHDYAEQVAELQDLNATFPSLTTLTSIGQTWEGRDLWCLKISDNPDSEETDEGAIFLVALHHAREILTPEVALYAARALLESYGNDEMITSFIDNREIYIVPSINPDGGEYDHSGNRFKMWRKNRRVNDNWPAFCMGVDLNRNYGYEWGGAGSTGFPCDLTYHGPDAFSEPETQAVRDFITAHENIRVVISLHTFAELVLWPWGYRYPPIDDLTDRAIFEQLGGYMAEQNGHTPQQSSKLYPTTGDTNDWAYGELGIYSFTFELTPKTQFAGGFYPDPSIIEPASEANFNAIMLGIGMSQTPVRVLSTDLWKLKADASETSVGLEWASIVETNAAGWNVTRRDESKAWVKLNDEPIPAGQAEYALTDDGVTPGATYEYKVEFLSSVGLDQEFTLSVSVPGGDDDTADDTVNDAGDDTAQPAEASGDDDDGGCGC